jgi:hypothetical protein
MTHSWKQTERMGQKRCWPKGTKRAQYLCVPLSDSGVESTTQTPSRAEAANTHTTYQFPLATSDARDVVRPSMSRRSVISDWARPGGNCDESSPWSLSIVLLKVAVRDRRGVRGQWMQVSRKFRCH